MNYIVQIPKFALGSVPLSVAAKVYGKDATWIKAGIIAGWLPIGYATRDKKLVSKDEKPDAMYGRINFYISPKRLWEDTGFVWEGEINEHDDQTGDIEEE